MSKKELSRNDRIQQKLSRIENLFLEMPANKKDLLCDLMRNAAFMAVALEDLQEDIKENGVIEIYTNGANQCGRKQSSAVQAYNNMIKNYKAVMEALAKELPEAAGRSKMDDYLAIVNDNE